MPSTTSPAPAGDPDGQTTTVPASTAVPGSAGKPSNGAATGSEDTNRADREATDHADFLRDVGLDVDEPADDSGDDAAPPAQDDAEQQTQTQADDQKPPEADQPPAPADDQKPDADPEKLTPEQEAKIHSFARRRIKNLETRTAQQQKELETAKPAAAALSKLSQVVGEAGYQDGKEAVEAITLVGRALKAKDQQAQAEIGKRLLAAGWKPPETAPAAPAIDIDAITAVLDEAADVGVDVSAARTALKTAKAGTPPKPEAPAPPAPEPPKPTPEPPVRPEIAQAQEAVTAAARELRQQHGAKADALLSDIGERIMQRNERLVKLTGHGIRPELWREVFNEERDAALAAIREQGRKRPTETLRSTPPSAKNSPKSFSQQLIDGDD